MKMDIERKKRRGTLHELKKKSEIEKDEGGGGRERGKK